MAIFDTTHEHEMNMTWIFEGYDIALKVQVNPQLTLLDIVSTYNQGRPNKIWGLRQKFYMGPFYM